MRTLPSKHRKSYQHEFYAENGKREINTKPLSGDLVDMRPRTPVWGFVQDKRHRNYATRHVWDKLMDPFSRTRRNYIAILLILCTIHELAHSFRFK